MRIDDDDSVAGVDGCRGGWVVAHARGIERVDAIAPLLDRFALVGVDMPIGLPDTWTRHADGEARRFLGRRGVTVFPTPPRALVAHTDYDEANADARSRFGRGLTRQTFHLLAKIREVDELDASALRERVVEIHPECAFARMAGRALPPKRSRAGRDLRRDLVRSLVGLDVRRTAGADEHDVLDACAVLWSARRYRVGTAVAFGDGATDARGVPMRIVS